MLTHPKLAADLSSTVFRSSSRSLIASTAATGATVDALGINKVDSSQKPLFKVGDTCKFEKIVKPVTESGGTSKFSELDHVSGPKRTTAFLARDLVDQQWLCFLTSQPPPDIYAGSQPALSGRRQLACLRIQHTESILTRSYSGYTPQLGSLIHLPLVDAVYLPGACITVGLQINYAIVLYTGVQKVIFIKNH
ncbi:unnamed protein product [Protopolystoma xenopodis]|uniref:Uncharacterized protein n=1 Tax=Protopolystoma xenopodis TaxID=117903 RepID=A0A3S5CLS6_9PLAT|nr:unnamed protein product [Protopolystoma xenopodis]